MKKRFLAMLLAGAMVMGLVGCGSSVRRKQRMKRQVRKNLKLEFPLWN